MKRIALSVIGGFVIPFAYAVIVGPLTAYTKNEAVLRFSYVPIGWPRLILQRIVPLNSFPFRDTDTVALLIYMIVCDVVLYALLTYFLLWRFSRRKNDESLVPPNPPSFVQH